MRTKENSSPTGSRGKDVHDSAGAKMLGLNETDKEIFASEATDEELEAADGMQFNDSNVLEYYLLLRLPQCDGQLNSKTHHQLI
jgi:hypothetical protein